MSDQIPLLLGQELLQIISQQDQQASEPSSPHDAAQMSPNTHARSGLSGLPDQAQAEEEVQESVADTAAHWVGSADGVRTDGQDEELRNALAAETEHRVCCVWSYQEACDVLKFWQEKAETIMLCSLCLQHVYVGFDCAYWKYQQLYCNHLPAVGIAASLETGAGIIHDYSS